MALTCWINANGSISDGDYVLGSDELLTGETFVGDLAISSPGGSWGSLNVIDGSTAWNYGGVNDNAEGLVPTGAGRMLLLWDEVTFQQDSTSVIYIDNTGTAKSRLRMNFTSSTNTQVQFLFNDHNSECLFDFTRTDGPRWIEIRYDHTEATAANRLQVRTWGIGESVPGSLSTATSNFGASGTTPDAFTSFYLLDPNNDSRYRIGFIAVDDDPDTDLSVYVADIEANNDAYPSGGGDPEGILIGGKLTNSLLIRGVLA